MKIPFLTFFVFSEVSFLPHSDELLWCSMTRRKNKGQSIPEKDSGQQFKFLFKKKRNILTVTKENSDVGDEVMREEH